MNLLWVNQFAVLPIDGGGTRHFELGRELVGKGWQVSVLASDFHLHRRDYTRRQLPTDRRVIPESLDDVEFNWLWAASYAGNDWRRLANWWTFSRAISQFGRSATRADVVIGSSPQLLAARAALQVARRWKCPFVFEVRDLWPESLVAAGGRQGLAYRALDHVAKDLYRSADLIIVLADGAGAYLKDRGVQTPIVCVPNGANVTDQPVELPDRSENEVTLVYAGAHSPANGLDTVLSSARLLGASSGVRFLFVGDGPNRKALEAQAAAEGLSHVEFRGPVSKTVLRDIFAEADAGLMVLREAPLFSFAVSPNKLFDYLAAGLPVINNVAGEVASMLTSSGAGLQAADSSAEALVEAICAFQKTPRQVRQQMRASGRNWVVANHSREVLGNRLVAALSSLR